MSGTTSGNSNLKEIYFTFKTLTPIAGEPDLESIHKLKKQHLANAENVPNVHHQRHGYLRLVMTADEYATISQTVFNRPGPVPDVNTNGTSAEIAARERQYQRDTAYLKEFTQMERILLQQVREAIEEEYLAAKLNPNTGNFTCYISELIKYLLDTYAYISEEELEVKRAEVTSMHYQAGQPVDAIFLKIDNFAELTHLAKSDITEAQKIAMGKVIILKTGAYETYLAKWDRQAPTNKTWSEFKTFFRAAHREQRQSRPTLRDVTPQMNQMAITDIIQQLQERMTNDETPSDIHMMCKATMQASETMMETLKTLVEQMKTKPHASNNNKPKKYCWTHGFQKSHTSSECNKKTDRHKDNATAANRMEGSNKGESKNN